MMRVRYHNCLALLALAAVAALLPVRTAHAAAYTYSTRQRTINAGIILLDDKDATGATISGMGEGGASPSAAQIAQGADNPDPYVFYVLNQRSDIKPFGWNIVNPLAPATVSSPILTRWNARSPNAYQLYQHITPNMAPYWEVPLAQQTDLDALLQFDVLLLNLQNHTVSLTSTEAEMLRRFLDGGGQLWVEDSGNGQVSDRLFLDFQFNNGAGAGAGVLPSVSGTLLRHPIIDAPFQLTPSEINGLGEIHIQNTIATDAVTPPDMTLFSTVVGNSSASNRPVIAAGQMGAGQIIITTTGSSAAINDSVGGVNPSGYGPNSGGYCGNNYAAAPTADLKFVVDLLSWDSAHPTEHKNSHQSSQTRSSLGPAVTPIWDYPITALSGATAPGAAINGDYVYARGVDGVLHAFNGQPGTDILGTGAGNPDAGFPDYVYGQPYDEMWSTGGDVFPGAASPLTLPASAGLSAPTVAAVPNGQTLAFVEGADGTVYAADAVTGAAYGSATGKLPNSGLASGGTPYSGVAPAPTFYGSRVYAGQPDGTLYVYDFNPGSASGGVKYSLNGVAEPVIASPAVGIVRDTVMNTQVDDIVAAVATNMGVYTVMLGARHDPLTYSGTNLIGQPSGVTVGTPPPVDSASPYFIYTETSGYPVPAPASYTTGVTYLGNYDVAFSVATSASLERAEFTANPSSGGYAAAPAPAAAAISATALGANSNLYYTVNLPVTVNGSSTVDSTLVCAHDTRQGGPGGPNRMNWRFRLPYAGENVVDADGVSYASLQGFTFQGTPVVDNRGNVFALAVSGTQAAVLCFNGNQAVSVQAIPGGSVPTGDTVTVTSMTQPLSGGTGDEFGGSPAQPIAGVTQFRTNPDGNGNIPMLSFGIGSSTSISPNVAEPQPVSLTYTLNTGNGQSTLETNPSAPMHTNMAWYALLPDAAFATGGGPPTSGLTLVGNYLFYGDGSGNVYRLSAYPGDSGLVGVNRSVGVGTPASPAKDSGGQDVLAAAGTQAGAISGVLSGGGDIMIANGSSGVVGLASRYTLVADNNRVLEVDSSGTASWAVDATTEATSTGALTHMDLSRPSDIFQLAANDYLVADTGNNRCVRFDRSGNVLWELTRFNDYANLTTSALFNKSVTLLTPGESTTLNHPTSVQSYKTFVPDTANPGTMATITHYLISDTGNYRVLEVVDVFDGKGNPVGPQHNLVWVSHTYDVQHRLYRYASASYFTGPNSKHYVAALVTNERLAQVPAPGSPATGQLGPAAGDAPGSSLVLLDYDPANALGTGGFGSGSQANGFISHAISTYTIFEPSDPVTHLPNGHFDISNAPKLPASGARTEPTAAQTNIVKVFLRNPRFLQTYTPLGGTNALQNFLLADDNGVFDLFLNSNSQFEAQWGFTQADYQAATGGGVSRANLKFLPNSLQRVGTEAVTDGVSTYLMGHYIVANGYSTGEVTPVSGFGGESLELNDSLVGGLLTTVIPSGTGAAFSKPGGTSPLSQPAFAVREK